MATVTAFTAARSLEIEQSSVTTGAVNINGDLILTTRGGTTINAGHVVGPAGTPVNTLEQTVKNTTGLTLNKGTVVYISGSTGDNVLVSKAQANSEATSSKTLGLVSENILNGASGDVTTEGNVKGLDTSTAIAGDSVWLSPIVPGGLVYGAANKPTSPNHMVYLGVVVRAHAINGAINVKVQNGYELDELHDVSVVTKNKNFVLARNQANTSWESAAPGRNIGTATDMAAILSVSPNGGAFYNTTDNIEYVKVGGVWLKRGTILQTVTSIHSTFTGVGSDGSREITSGKITPKIIGSKLVVRAIGNGLVKYYASNSSYLNVNFLRNQGSAVPVALGVLLGIAPDGYTGGACVSHQYEETTASTAEVEFTMTMYYYGAGYGGVCYGGCQSTMSITEIL